MDLSAHFALIARYNVWANRRLYGMAGTLPDDAYRRNVGAYFGSLHGTLNHLLTADRIWMHRMTGEGTHPERLDAIVHDDLVSLHEAREAEDTRITDFVGHLQEGDFERQLEYRTIVGNAMHRQPLREALAHFFNHQTHHRGQGHTILTVLGMAEPLSLDLLIMLREKA